MTAAARLDLLRSGDLTINGRLVAASNATFQGVVSLGDETATVVYKPVSGERPLWDFPDGTLAARETAAYVVSTALGWNVVPPTVLREGPFGEGMVQLWIDGDETVDLGRMVRADRPALRRMAVFDAVVNNADRKGGHVLTSAEGRVYGVDHGVCFHADDKLRTILWGWAGSELPGEVAAALAELRGALDTELGRTLSVHLTTGEVAAVRDRIDRLLRAGTYPEPDRDWPVLPWPPI